MVGGDFNIVRFSNECRGGDNNDKDRDGFNDLVGELKLKEILFTDRKFT